MVEIKATSTEMVAAFVDGVFLQEEYQDEIIDSLEDLAEAQPAQNALIISKGMSHDLIDKALELAGLDGLPVAKQQATGKVVF